MTIKYKHSIFKSRFLVTICALVVWATWWLASQALFIINVPFLSDWLTAGRTSLQSFIAITLCIVVSTATASLLYFMAVRDYGFLKGNKWNIALYIIPMVLFIRLITMGEVYGIPAYIYGIGMIVSALTQDLVTFGYLQTVFEKRMARIAAAIFVGAVFFIAHFMYGLSFATAFYLVGFFVFALLRYRLRTPYVTNVLHMSFLLLV